MIAEKITVTKITKHRTHLKSKCYIAKIRVWNDVLPLDHYRQTPANADGIHFNFNWTVVHARRSLFTAKLWHFSGSSFSSTACFKYTEYTISKMLNVHGWVHGTCYRQLRQDDDGTGDDDDAPTIIQSRINHILITHRFFFSSSSLPSFVFVFGAIAHVHNDVVLTPVKVRHKWAIRNSFLVNENRIARKVNRVTTRNDAVYRWAVSVWIRVNVSPPQVPKCREKQKRAITTDELINGFEKKNSAETKMRRRMPNAECRMTIAGWTAKPS